MPGTIELPLVDLGPYLNPKAPGDREKVVAEVREACSQFGFFQVKNHGGLRVLRYDLREGDALPDSKEAFYIGREDPVVEPSGFHCSNVWPDMAEQDFHDPVWQYYEDSGKLGRTIWEILLEGLNQPVSTLEGQFGVGAHNGFGGVTVLLQQPGREGLEVWVESEEAWLPVPSLEDVYVINCGDIIMKWSGGVYMSARHRVVNKDDHERLSFATFWHGDVGASNPLDPDAPRETVGQLLVKRFGS
ncbi:Isopenicillin N synthase [Geosmithia morbida]|uniref:Isopenicillin N synthase n=1 Tax=Geosmithia morbida TaxID=1094350 RepID=A0A9P4YQT5_9HYPO|nr:Isopenicillin N synthase [Geosmithia morbida]KAF4119339.1 Isopenicillin N synthase [Geosmithia morbida]